MTTDEEFIRGKQDPKACSLCGGRCCKACGCPYFPEDFQELTFESLKKLIDSKKVEIDSIIYLSGPYTPLPNPVYYLRVANKKEGGCIHLTEKGCKLSYEERPTGGRLLVPHWSGCYYLYSKEEFIEKWLPYQELLEELINSSNN
jgi:Fe-S-cluster containining protein